MQTCSSLTKICSRCWEPKPWTAYTPRTYWDDGTVRNVSTYCRECTAAYRREWRQNNRERDQEVRQRYWRNLREDAERLEHRRAKIREYCVDYRSKRGSKGRGNTEGGREFLPVEPFAEFLRWVMRTDELDRRALARVADMTEETVRRILNGRQESVEVATVDAALCRDGRRTLADVYGPDVAFNAQGV